jgi:hypothetical protein
MLSGHLRKGVYTLVLTWLCVDKHGLNSIRAPRSRGHGSRFCWRQHTSSPSKTTSRPGRALASLHLGRAQVRPVAMRVSSCKCWPYSTMLVVAATWPSTSMVFLRIAILAAAWTWVLKQVMCNSQRQVADGRGPLARALSRACCRRKPPWKGVLKGTDDGQTAVVGVPPLLDTKPSLITDNVRRSLQCTLSPGQGGRS